jgi:hypothetical protein
MIFDDGWLDGRMYGAFLLLVSFLSTWAKMSKRHAPPPPSSSSSAIIDLTGDTTTDDEAPTIQPLQKRQKQIIATEESNTTKAAPPPPLVENPWGRVRLTRLTGPPSTTPSIDVTLRQLLTPPSGYRLRAMTQFNFQVDLDFLLGNMLPDDRRRVLITVVHGWKDEMSCTSFNRQCSHFPNIRAIQAKTIDQYSTHHSKMMILFYNDASGPEDAPVTRMRVVVHTANLIAIDWGLKTQGVWESPLFSLKAAPSTVAGCLFERDLIRYLAYYGGSTKHLGEQVRRFDMSQCRAIFLSSVPGKLDSRESQHHGHMQLRQVLKEQLEDAQWSSEDRVVAQFSSVGSLGASADS